tara:strand:+ start:165 stop:377 length:213 start_codon:yes stop_codon:yes gene_type:complete
MAEEKRTMGDIFLEYEAELLAKAKAYSASPQAAIDDAKRTKRVELEEKRRIAWEESLTQEEREEHFGRDE